MQYSRTIYSNKINIFIAFKMHTEFCGNSEPGSFAGFVKKQFNFWKQLRPSSILPPFQCKKNFGHIISVRNYCNQKLDSINIQFKVYQGGNNVNIKTMDIQSWMGKSFFFNLTVRR